MNKMNEWPLTFLELLTEPKNNYAHLPVHDEGADVGGDEGVHPGAGPGPLGTPEDPSMTLRIGP